MRETLDAALAEEKTRLSGQLRDLERLKREAAGKHHQRRESARCEGEAAQRVKEREGEKLRLMLALQELEAAMEEEDIATYVRTSIRTWWRNLLHILAYIIT